jgi:hypothetical protein
VYTLQAMDAEGKSSSRDAGKQAELAFKLYDKDKVAIL